MKDDSTWFFHSFYALIELTCPNTNLSAQAAEFFSDIEVGMSISRSGLLDDEKPSGGPELTPALIATAPELLASAKAVIEAAKGDGIHSTTEMLSNTLPMLEATIAKAEGSA